MGKREFDLKAQGMDHMTEKREANKYPFARSMARMDTRNLEKIVSYFDARKVSSPCSDAIFSFAK